ncbi:MAG: DUF1704 domain-containing protein [Kiritimatiellae bacterium]|nr:DUF1704 domain-containing protein [Kiritimatiellia bacterium]
MAGSGSQAKEPWVPPSGLIDDVRQRLRENKPIRRTLPVGGRIHIDRQIPFLCIWRRPVGDRGAGAENLVTSEASYLVCSAQRRLHNGMAELVRGVVEVLVEQFGTCLLLELWEAPAGEPETPVSATRLSPAFRVIATRGASTDDVTEDIETALCRVKLERRPARVSTACSAKSCPSKLRPFLSSADAAKMDCLLYGIEIAPVYRSVETCDVFPRVLRRLRHSLSIALRRAIFDFSRKHTTHSPAHYHTLGRRAVVKAVWDVDRMLAEASDQFDFLLQLTPVNAEQAWSKFKRSRYQGSPTFHYRPLPAEPAVLKRRLYRAPVERIEDPALALIFREKMDEVDRQITMLQDRSTPRALHESIQLFGAVEDDLLDLAVHVLSAIPPRSRERRSKGYLGPEQVAQLARREIAYLRRQDPTLNAGVEVRSDISGMLVSRGNLLISDHLRVPESRAPALLQHEVGTHVLTFHNGRCQPFRQLCAGLAGYEALQEGLAVLSEYLVGGLSRPRLRLLAGRVVAVQCLLEGASFIDTYRRLETDHGFADRSAFMVAMRVYRGGGLTKDAVYPLTHHKMSPKDP